MGRRYFTSDTFDFLQDLEVRNEKAFFDENRQRYEDCVRTPALELVADLAEPLATRVSKHLVAEPKKQGGSLMRIHRDIRFSNDKTPYKTNIGIQLRHVDGKDVHAPGVYLHFEPGMCFIGSGMWAPPSDALTKIRAAIDARPKRWTAARDAVTKGAWGLHDGALKRAPKGYTPDHPMIDDLKRTSYITTREFTERQATATTLADQLVTWMEESRPLLAWLCAAVGVRF